MTAVRGSRSGRPIMALLDLLGRRWTLRVLWELRDGPLTARALRTACDEASPTVLNARLADLKGAALVAHEAGRGYALTDQGQRMMAAFEPLLRFSAEWEPLDGPAPGNLSSI